MHDLGWYWRPVDNRRRYAAFNGYYWRGDGCRTEWADLPADQRSHVGFDKPANPNALGTLEEAVNKIKTFPVKPSFVIHTGDITHLSKPSEFDDADRIIHRAGSTCITFLVNMTSSTRT